MKKITFLLFLVLCTSCNVFYNTVVGIDTSPKWLTNKTLIKEFNKQQIPLQNRYVLDTSSYHNAILKNYNDIVLTMDSSKNEDSIVKKNLYKVTKDDTQPVQVRYFDSDYNQIFKIVNCYIDNPLAIDWNVNNCFDVYPPRINIDDLNNDKKKLPFFIEHIYTVSNEKVVIEDLPKSDYYVLVFWNSFFRKPSKKLIKTIKKFENDNKIKNTYILYVNNQNAEIWSHIDKEQKSKLNLSTE